jgi:hypothetical protein
MKEMESGPPAVTSGAGEHPLPGPFPSLWAAAVCILTFLAYLPTLRFQFVHDDRGIIVENPAIHAWHAVAGYFTSAVWAGVAPAYSSNAYRPVYLLWFRVNDAIFGQHAAGWHFTSVIAHVVATYCVFLLAYRIFGERSIALFSGLVFGLHPVHIEAVAWISGVDDALVAGLIISAYLCWVRSREMADGGRGWLGASLALYAVALLIKEIAIVLPLILCASQWLDFPRPLEPRPRTILQKPWRVLKVLLPHLALTAVYLMVHTVVLKGFLHPSSQISWLTIVLTWPSLLLFYLKLLLWPVGLSPFYGLLFVSHPTLRNSIFPGMGLLLVTVGLWKWASRSRYVALAIPWLIVPVLPVLNVQVFDNGNFAHNRYLYLPSIGFAMLVAAALKNFQFGRPLFDGLWSSQLWVCLGLAMLMGFAIQVEDRIYASDAAFYSFAYRQRASPDPVIAMDYANTLAEQGDSRHAAEIYGKLIQAHPDLWGAYFNYGYMSYQLGELNSAAVLLSRAAAGDPNNAGAFFYLGLADLKLNRIDEAEANLRRAILLSPLAANHHFALGMVLRLKGDLPGALAEFTKEVELNPRHQAAAQQAAEIQRQVVGN